MFPRHRPTTGNSTGARRGQDPGSPCQSHSRWSLSRTEWSSAPFGDTATRKRSLVNVRGSDILSLSTSSGFRAAVHGRRNRAISHVIREACQLNLYPRCIPPSTGRSTPVIERPASATAKPSSSARPPATTTWRRKYCDDPGCGDRGRQRTFVCRRRCGRHFREGGGRGRMDRLVETVRSRMRSTKARKPAGTWRRPG
jgi:hypothetical protein